MVALDQTVLFILLSTYPDMKSLTILLIIGILQSCSLLHHQDAFEMERLSEDVLSSKGNRGISITVMPIEQKKDQK